MRQTLNMIRRENNITLEQMAQKAGVEVRVVYVAGIGGKISAAEAEKLLTALSEITGKTFTQMEVKLNIRNLLQERRPDMPVQPLFRGC